MIKNPFSNTGDAALIPAQGANIPCATMKTQCRQHLIKTERNNRKCQLLSIVLGLGEGKKSVQNPKHTDEV